MEKNEWKSEMSGNGNFVDIMFLQVFSNIVQRKLIIIPVFRATGLKDTGVIEIEPKHEAGLPFYYLYYSDQRFRNGHYQSIRPIHEHRASIIQAILPPVVPTELPTVLPIDLPTDLPLVLPIDLPTIMPTELPPVLPTDLPIVLPIDLPTVMPTSQPTLQPIVRPPVMPITPPTTPTMHFDYCIQCFLTNNLNCNYCNDSKPKPAHIKTLEERKREREKAKSEEKQINESLKAIQPKEQNSGPVSEKKGDIKTTVPTPPNSPNAPNVPSHTTVPASKTPSNDHTFDKTAHTPLHGATPNVLMKNLPKISTVHFKGFKGSSINQVKEMNLSESEDENDELNDILNDRNELPPTSLIFTPSSNGEVIASTAANTSEGPPIVSSNSFTSLTSKLLEPRIPALKRKSLGTTLNMREIAKRFRENNSNGFSGFERTKTKRGNYMMTSKKKKEKEKEY